MPALLPKKENLILDPVDADRRAADPCRAQTRRRTHLSAQRARAVQGFHMIVKPDIPIQFHGCHPIVIHVFDF